MSANTSDMKKINPNLSEGSAVTDEYPAGGKNVTIESVPTVDSAGGQTREELVGSDAYITPKTLLVIGILAAVYVMRR